MNINNNSSKQFHLFQEWSVDGQRAISSKAILSEVKYNCVILNSILQITVQQTFKNNAESNLSNAKYFFPVSEGICLESFIAKYSGIEVKAEVKEKSQAKLEFNSLSKKGNITSYAESEIQGSEEFLLIKLRNIPPQESIGITLKFSQQLSSLFNKYFHVSIPIQISEGEDRIELESNILSLKLLCTGRITFVESIGYPVEKNQIDDNSLEINLQQQYSQKGVNFKLIFAFEGMFNPQIIFGASKGYNRDAVKQAIMPCRSSASIQFLPNFNEETSAEIQNDVETAILRNEDIESEIFNSTLNEKYINNIEKSKSEFIFFLDRSGSMEGKPITSAIESLNLFLKSLPSDSYFNVISFGSNFEKLFNQSEKYTSDNLKYAIQQIAEFSADLGGTEIYQPIHDIMSTQKIEGYNRQIFLLTDGAIMSPDRVISLIKENRQFNRVHSIGFGEGVDKRLIEEIAKAGQGIKQFVKIGDDLSNLIIEMLNKSISPTLDNFKISFDQTVIDSVYPNFEKFPCVFKNEVFNLHLFFKPSVDITSLTQQQKTLNISYTDSSTKKEITYELQLNEMDVFSSNSGLKESIFRFSKNMQLRDLILKQSETQEEQLGSLIREAVEFQLLTPQTALVCLVSTLNDAQQIQFKEEISQDDEDKEVQKETCFRLRRSQNSNKYLLSQNWMYQKTQLSFETLLCLRNPDPVIKDRSRSRSLDRKRVRRINQAENGFQVKQENDDGFLQLVEHKKELSLSLESMDCYQSTELKTILDSVDFEGVWTFQKEKVIEKLRITESQLNDLLSNFTSNNGLMTLLMLCVLETNFAFEKSKWNLIAKKTISWLKRDLKPEIDINQIKEVIKQHLQKAF